jgi:hypothetical protein
LARGCADVGEITIEQIEWLLGGRYSSFTGFDQIFKVLNQIYVFKALPSSKLVEVTAKLETINIKKGDVVFREGD